MSPSEQLFVSRLRNLPVYGPSGEEVGRVQDVVVALGWGGTPSVVLGLVISILRRPVFVSMGKVSDLGADGVRLTTGNVNLRTFEKRTGETLVLGELLDQDVRHAETGQPLRINDVAITRKREGWHISAVDVLVPTRGLAPWRRAGRQRLAWEMVADLRASNSAESRIAALANLRPADLADALQALPPASRRQVVAGLDDDRLAEALEELPEEDQASLLAWLDEERAADVLAEMDPDDATDLLKGLHDQVAATHYLALMEPDEAEPIRRLLAYDEETAGGLMTTDPVVMRASDTVAEALARIRNPDLPPALAGQVFVVRPPTETPTGRYLGVAHFQRLLREPPSEEVGAVIDTDLGTLSPEAPTRRVAEYLATYDLLAAPVCDPAGRLLGAVSVDDVLDHLLPAAWRKGPARARTASAGRGNGNANANGESGDGGRGR